MMDTKPAIKDASYSGDNAMSLTVLNAETSTAPCMTERATGVIDWKPWRFQNESQVKDFYNQKLSAIENKIRPYLASGRTKDIEYRRLQRQLAANKRKMHA